MQSANTVVRRAEYRIDRYVDPESPRLPTRFYVWEPEQSFPGGRSTIDVDVYPPHEAFGGIAGTRVGWPSTSDQRPLAARALAEALTLAAAEADRLDAAAYLMTDDFEDDIRDGALVFLVEETDVCEGVATTWRVRDELNREALVPAGSLPPAVER